MDDNEIMLACRKFWDRYAARNKIFALEAGDESFSISLYQAGNLQIFSTLQLAAHGDMNEWLIVLETGKQVAEHPLRCNLIAAGDVGILTNLKGVRTLCAGVVSHGLTLEKMQFELELSKQKCLQGFRNQAQLLGQIADYAIHYDIPDGFPGYFDL